MINEPSNGLADSRHVLDVIGRGMEPRLHLGFGKPWRSLPSSFHIVCPEVESDIPDWQIRHDTIATI